MDRSSILIAFCSSEKKALFHSALESKYFLFEVSTKEAALEILSHETVQFIFVDEAVGGIALCQYLRSLQRFQYTPILLVLNEHNGHVTQQALDAGMTNFLTPPLTAEAIDTAILVSDRYTKAVHELTSFSHKLKGLAEHDPLTHLYNRYFLFDQGSKEVAKAQRGHFPLSLLILDVDHFKEVNDTHGHLVGDEILAELAHFIVKNQRSYDIAARFGGEEFVILLPNTTKEQATTVGEKIRGNVASRLFSSLKVPVTVSIGVSSLTPTQKTLEELLQAADYALYQSKLEGRNRVSVA